MAFRWRIDLPRYIFFAIWMFINFALCCFYFFWFEFHPQFAYMRVRTRQALSFARMPALMINFNTALVLLPICRNLISFVRGCCKCAPRGVRTLLDKNITFHQWFAWAIVVGSAIHTVAHWYNYERFTALAILPDGSSPFAPTQANPPGVNVPSLDAFVVCFTTVAGVTGHVMVLVLFLMVTSSVEFIRRSFFEVFWYTHHLFIIYFIALALHQTQRLLPVLTNYEVHDFTYCSTNQTIFEDDPECNGNNAAAFTAAGPTSFYWFMGPLFVYVVERVIRLVSFCLPVVVTKVVEHPSQVYEIQMKRRWFHAEVGQYIFINVPSASVLEWHPFTLTSAPEEDYISVHIRIVGDWTQHVADNLGIGSGEFQQSWQLPKIFIDGPFGTATEDIFNFEVVLLCGAGIGVTPFASALKSIWYKLQEGGPLRLKKVYFFWINSFGRSVQGSAFEWFQDLLQNVEGQMIENGWGEFLEYNIHLTSGWSDTDAKQIMLHDEAEDAVTGLQQKTYFGRPNWPQVFERVALAHPGADVGVLFCGPKSLSSTLHKQCNVCNQRASPQRARFFYNKENF